MKKLIVLLLILCFSCKKKSTTPNEVAPEPVVKKNKYYFRSTTALPGTRFTDPKISNYFNISDTAYFELMVNSVSVYKKNEYSPASPGSPGSYGVNFNLTNVIFKSGDYIKWTCKMITYNIGVTNCIFKSTNVSTMDTLNKKVDVFTNTVDTIPYVKSSNTYTASKTWEFTAP